MQAQSRGFTLIELMIVVAIIAILAAIAYPSYQQHVYKTRRTAAQGCLHEMAQFMERYYTTNMTYAGAALPDTACKTELASFYDIAFSDGPAAFTFTVSATPKGAQAGDSCGTLTLNQAGTKTPSTSGCW